VDLAQIGACDNAISLTIKRVTEGDGLVDNLLEFAWWWVVVKSLFDDVSEQVVDLLLTVTDGRGSNDGTIKGVREALHLAPAVAPTFRTALVVGVNLLFGAEETGGKLATNYSKLSDATVPKRVESVVVQSAVRVERDSVVVGTEVSKATVSNACSCTVDDTTRQRVGPGVDLEKGQRYCSNPGSLGTYSETTTSSTHPSVLEVARRRKPVLLKYPVVFSCMSVCKRDIAVVKGGVREEGLAADSGIVNGIGGDGRRVEEVGAILRERVANVRDGADLAQRSSLSNGSRGRSGEGGNTHILIEWRDTVGGMEELIASLHWQSYDYYIYCSFRVCCGVGQLRIPAMSVLRGEGLFTGGIRL